MTTNLPSPTGVNVWDALPTFMGATDVNVMPTGSNTSHVAVSPWPSNPPVIRMRPSFILTLRWLVRGTDIAGPWDHAPAVTSNRSVASNVYVPSNPPNTHTFPSMAWAVKSILASNIGAASSHTSGPTSSQFSRPISVVAVTAVPSCPPRAINAGPPAASSSN